MLLCAKRDTMLNAIMLLSGCLLMQNYISRLNTYSKATADAALLAPAWPVQPTASVMALRTSSAHHKGAPVSGKYPQCTQITPFSLPPIGVRLSGGSPGCELPHPYPN